LTITNGNDKLIDFRSLGEYIGDNKENHKTFFMLFIEQTNMHLKLLGESIAKSDYNDISLMAHKIRPVYGTMGIDEGHRLLVQIEELSKSKSDIKEIQNKFEIFHDLNKQIFNEIKEYLSES